MDNIPPFLTLQQLRETGPLGQQLILAARRHVGEAGLEQAASLERLLVACRQQVAVTTALRSLGWALGRMTDDDPGRTRAELLTALQEQLDNAERAEEVLANSLRDVTSTPVIFVSAAALNEIEQRALQQLIAAQQLVAQASHGGGTPDERETLRQVDQRMRTALAHAAEEEALGRAQTLVYLIQDAATRLIALPTLPDPALADLLEDVAAGLRVQATRQVSPTRQ